MAIVFITRSKQESFNSISVDIPALLRKQRFIVNALFIEFCLSIPLIAFDYTGMYFLTFIKNIYIYVYCSVLHFDLTQKVEKRESQPKAENQEIWSKCTRKQKQETFHYNKMCKFTNNLTREYLLHNIRHRSFLAKRPRSDNLSQKA